MDASTISSLATAGGTLVLAIATFSSVRSANKAARTAERALQAGLRPLLMQSRFQDPDEKVGWVDQHWAKVPGGEGYAAIDGDVIYLAMNLRNVGSGMAVLHGWCPLVADPSNPLVPPAAVEDFRRLSRDLYIPAGDSGFWQGAIRDDDDPDREWLTAAIKQRELFRVDVLYGDHEGGQRTITRFSLNPRESAEGWIVAVARHWNIDRADPR